jgi:hypothetical protein
MILIGGPQSAPSGFLGIVASGGVGAEGTNIVSAIQRPSGDQVRLPGDSVRLVSSASCPVSIQRTQI